MKKTALFLAMSTAAVFTQAETVEVKLPTFYGKFNVTQEFVQQEDAGNFSQLNSNASRLGLKGDFALNHGLTAIYQAEFEIDVDGDGDVFKQRNTFAGVKGGFGKVQAGVFDSALKASQKKVDLFNDLQGEIKHVITNSENRVKNVVRYQSPKMGGVVLTADHINSEDETVNNGISASAAFSNDEVYVAYAYDSEVEGEAITVSRLVGQFNIDNVQLGALWESQDTDGDSADGYVASVAVKLSAVKLKAQYGASDIKAEGASTMSLGADYKLAKNAKTFVYVTNEEAAEDAGSNQYYGAGIEYKF
ncbi:MAG: putative porin [Thalassolituus sp.]|jgi:predicted porin